MQGWGCASTEPSQVPGWDAGDPLLVAVSQPAAGTFPSRPLMGWQCWEHQPRHLPTFKRCDSRSRDPVPCWKNIQCR